MSRILFTSADAALAGLIMIPIFWFINKKYIHNCNRAICYFFFAVYLSAVYAVAGLPDIRYIRFNPHFNFEPFAYMFSDAASSLLNVLLFVPMGFFPTILWKQYTSFHRILLLGLAGSILIETLQIFTFRATDVNDLITNATGTLIGWLMGRLFLLLFGNSLPDDSYRDLFGICAVTLFVMFFIHPFLPSLLG